MKKYKVGDKIKLKCEYHPIYANWKPFKEGQIVSVLSKDLYLVRDEWNREYTIPKDVIENSEKEYQELLKDALEAINKEMELGKVFDNYIDDHLEIYKEEIRESAEQYLTSIFKQFIEKGE
jgi:hypothetical protein